VLNPVAVVPKADETISQGRLRALALFRALTGVPLPIDDDRLVQMEAAINAGRERDAAKIATSDPLFYDVRVRDMARKMSTREESVRAPLSDFVATFVGVVRDSDTTSAKELLTGNFTYRGKAGLMQANGQAVRQDLMNDFLNSNNHYNDLANPANKFSLMKVLEKSPIQKVVMSNANTVPVDHPDPAGLITTRAFMEAHAIAGTNRRLVEFSFRQFMCQPITQWADASAPDDRVGRDVDRAPGGSPNKFMVTCKACHGQMDGLRGAFAMVDFNGNQVRYQAGTNPVGKMNRNADVFPEGFQMRDNSFVNYATEGKNRDEFGWRSDLQGKGMKEFAAMIANSQGFSRCLVRRVFSNVCKRDAGADEEGLIRAIANDFEAGNYHLRNLFETVALRPECVGTK
jgi:hypothetical protein